MKWSTLFVLSSAAATVSAAAVASDSAPVTIAQRAVNTFACEKPRGVQLLLNPGFETSGQWLFLPTSSDVTMERANTGAHDGSRALRVKIGGATTQPQYFMQPLPICGGRAYKVRIWHKRTEGAGTIQIRAYLDTMLIYNLNVASSTWTQAPLTSWVAPQDIEATNLRFQIVTSGGEGQAKEVFIDGIEMAPLS